MQVIKIFSGALLVAATLFLASPGQANPLVRLRQTTFDPVKENSSRDRLLLNTQRLWIVSSSTPITEKLKSELAKNGYEVLAFIPEQSLLVRGERKEIEISNLTAWTAFQPAWKWSEELHAPSILYRSARILVVRLHMMKDRASFLAKIETKDRVFVLHQSDTYFIVRGYDEDLYQISEMEEVAHLQDLPDYKTMDFDLGITSEALPIKEITGFETGTRLMNFEAAWNQGFKGEGQIVAMGDTGLDKGETKNIHADFAGAVVSGKSFVPFGRSWEDPMGHGTHVAGFVIGRGTESEGKFKGGAHGAKLIAQSLWSRLLSNLMIPTKLGDMFSSAQSGGATVHTNSWGALKNFGAYDSFARQVDEFTFNNPDLLVLFSAGNAGVDKNKDGRIDGDSIGSPATAKNALTVGASENLEHQGGYQKKISEFKDAKNTWSKEPIFSSKVSDNPRGLAMFSSRGPTDDGRIKPEVVAPGTNILSTRSRHNKAKEMWGVYDQDYVWSGGTSMATPLVAGAAAVTREILQKEHGIQKPSATLIKALLMNSATDLFPGQYGQGGASQGQEILTVRPNNDEGFGLVNMEAVLNKASIKKLHENRKGLATGESEGLEFELAESGTLAITLVWNDAPGIESSGRTLVNNLDIEITGPETQFHSTDAVNNFEHYEKSAKPGRYSVKVLGRQIPLGHDGRQPYSLVIRSQSDK